MNGIQIKGFQMHILSGKKSTLIYLSILYSTTLINAQNQCAELIFPNRGYYGSVKLSVITGDKYTIADITKQSDAEIIVNAANDSLLGGAGVDGAIHKAAGAQLKKYILEHFSEIFPNTRCTVGNVIYTPAFDLEKQKVHFILHAVAPDCRNKAQNKKRAALLKSCYEKCF